MDKDVAAALVMMANAIQNLADAQKTLIDNTGAIRGELRDQSRTLAKSVANQKKRSAEMMETARQFSEEAANRVRTPRR
jgi:hypothetical protein